MKTYKKVRILGFFILFISLISMFESLGGVMLNAQWGIKALGGFVLAISQYMKEKTTE